MTTLTGAMDNARQWGASPRVIRAVAYHTGCPLCRPDADAPTRRSHPW